ncbi:MAG: LptF/LptG family permease, partial [Planctomycetes bacterium]|nr:LptF/LptG family permease [Planctomycetota bacterium]
AFTLPFAALFAAATTYGRLSADNEFVACRSSGINMYVLFLPAVVLSLLSAVVTFVCINFLIPGKLRNLTEFVGADLGAYIEHQLNRPRGLILPGGYRVYADKSFADPAHPNRISLQHAAFVVNDGDEWLRFGTVREVTLDLVRDESRIQVSGAMGGLSYYDRRASQFFEQARQAFYIKELPTLVPQKIKFLDLGGLLYHLANPLEWREPRDALVRLRAAVGRQMVLEALWEDWLDGNALVLGDDRVQYSIRSTRGAPPHEGGIELAGVVVDEDRRGERRRHTAARAVIDLTGAKSFTDSGIGIELYDVEVAEGRRVSPRSRENLGPTPIPQDLIERAANLAPEEMLASPGNGVAEDPLAEKRNKARDTIAATTRNIVATINERFTFSLSVLVLVILGAVLGIVFRGAHAVTAFGISFAPSLVVIIAIIMGKQMAQNATSYLPGLLVMWSGLVIVAGLDVWTLTRVLRR